MDFWKVGSEKMRCTSAFILRTMLAGVPAGATKLRHRLKGPSLPGAAVHHLRDDAAATPDACFPLIYNPAFRTIGRPRLATYSLPSIGPTCGGSRSR